MADPPEALDEVLLTALTTERGDRYEHVLYLRDKLQARQRDGLAKQTNIDYSHL